MPAFRRWPLALALVLLTTLGPACIKHPPRHESPPPLTADVAEMDPNSLPVEVTAFRWSLIHGGSHIKIQGTAKNIGPDIYQAVTLRAMALDEKGGFIGEGSSYLTPTYLPPDQNGTFEITVMLPRDRPIRHLRLVTSAKVLQ